MAGRAGRVAPGLVLLLLLTMPLDRASGLHAKTCSSPLGLESGEIPDEALTASSYYVFNVGPHSARLNQDRHGGGWCPKGQVDAGSREFLEVALGGARLLTAVATQGRQGRGRGVEYAEEYTVEYWRRSIGAWRAYRRWDGKKVFTGNSDTMSVVRHSFAPPVHASSVRLYPHSLRLRTVCLRFELYGCVDDGGVLSYSAPPGSADLGDHTDREYDGEGGHGGLGRLTDGQVGADFFLIDIGYARGSGWVGWKNSSFPSGYMEITFQLDGVRNVTQVDLFTNNYHTRNVQVFRTAVVYFSVGGKYFNGDPVLCIQPPDRSHENARNVSISIGGGRVAKFVRVRLYFQAEWIMLSEVYFTSELVDSNVTEETEQKSFEDILELTLLEKDWENNQSESRSDLIIGSIAAVGLILIILTIVIFIVNKRKSIGLFNRSSYLGNDFPMKINMKDLFSNLSPDPQVMESHQGDRPEGREGREGMVARAGAGVGLGVGPGAPGKASYVTAASPRGGAVVSLAPEVFPHRGLEYPASSHMRRSSFSGHRERRTLERDGTREIYGLPDYSNTNRRFISPDQINTLTGAPAYMVWNIGPNVGMPYDSEDVRLTDIPLSYLNLVSHLGHSTVGDVSSVDILQHSRGTCAGRIQSRGSRGRSHQELLFP